MPSRPWREIRAKRFDDAARAELDRAVAEESAELGDAPASARAVGDAPAEPSDSEG